MSAVRFLYQNFKIYAYDSLEQIFSSTLFRLLRMIMIKVALGPRCTGCYQQLLTIFLSFFFFFIFQLERCQMFSVRSVTKLPLNAFCLTNDSSMTCFKSSSKKSVLPFCLTVTAIRNWSNHILKYHGGSEFAVFQNMGTSKSVLLS